MEVVGTIVFEDDAPFLTSAKLLDLRSKDVHEPFVGQPNLLVSPNLIHGSHDIGSTRHQPQAPPEFCLERRWVRRSVQLAE